MTATNPATEVEDEAILRRLLDADLSSLGFDNAEVRATLLRLQERLPADEPDSAPGFLTTTQAARQLGVQSSNTIKNWARSGYLRGVRRGGRLLIPTSEIARIRDADHVERVRRTEQLLDASVALGDDDIPEATLRDLAENRPGILPWHRTK